MKDDEHVQHLEGHGSDREEIDGCYSLLVEAEEGFPTPDGVGASRAFWEVPGNRTFSNFEAERE